MFEYTTNPDALKQRLCDFVKNRVLYCNSQPRTKEQLNALDRYELVLEFLRNEVENERDTMNMVSEEDAEKFLQDAARYIDLKIPKAYAKYILGFEPETSLAATQVGLSFYFPENYSQATSEQYAYTNAIKNMPASEKQLSFLASLLQNRNMKINRDLTALTREEASAIISYIKDGAELPENLKGVFEQDAPRPVEQLRFDAASQKQQAFLASLLARHRCSLTKGLDSLTKHEASCLIEHFLTNKELTSDIASLLVSISRAM